MTHRLKNIWQNSSARVMVLLFAALMAIVVFFLTYGYFTQLHLHQEKILSLNLAIAKTLANDLSGDRHQRLFDHYPRKDDIRSAEQDIDYNNLHQKLRMAMESNGLTTDIYTLVRNPKEEGYLFAVTSGETPYYRHSYKLFPEAFVTKFNEGATLPPYTSENGHWLSAFSPIRNSNDEVVAVVQVDQNYSGFIAKTNRAIFLNSLLSLGIMLIIAVFLIRAIRKILDRDAQLHQDLSLSHQEVAQKNQDITDSIFYARKIQAAISPSVDRIRQVLPDSFVLNLPRDIVSGDFYWFAEVENKVVLAAVDCTGHGVPGAFMSMIGTILLNTICIQNEEIHPGTILNELDRQLIDSLRKNQESQAADGMDIALVVLDKETQELEFSGALRPLICQKGEDITVIRGDRYPIGGDYENKPEFTTHKLQLAKGESFFIFSDGYIDQFGGPHDKKFMMRRFKSCLHEFRQLSMADTQTKLHNTLLNWKMDQEQIDDVLVIGFRV